MEFYAKTFEELSNRELYEILKARARIFVVEQKIRYVDEDNTDLQALHCFLMDDGEVVGYLRAYYQQDNQSIARIGRVLSLHHGKGIGALLMLKAQAAIKEKMNVKAIAMDAQKHAIGFYQKLGYKVTSDDFLEEGIVHVTMEKDL